MWFVFGKFLQESKSTSVDTQTWPYACDTLESLLRRVDLRRFAHTVSCRLTLTAGIPSTPRLEPLKTEHRKLTTISDSGTRIVQGEFELIPPLRLGTHDTQALLEMSTSGACRRCTPKQSLGASDIKSTFRHGSGIQRRQIIQMLGDIGPNAKDALPELRKALKDPDEDTRRMAAEAIRRIEQ